MSINFSCNRPEFQECLEVLDILEHQENPPIAVILNLKAAVFLSLGDIVNGRRLLENGIEYLGLHGSSQDMLDKLKYIHHEFLDNELFEQILSVSENSLLVKLASDTFEQPRGVKIRYWLGLAQIIAGIAIVPFSGGISSGLILSGIGMAGSACADALDNKDNWERNLNQRQRIGT